MIDTDVPETFEADWSPLTRALQVAMWRAQLILPRKVVVALVAAVVDELVAERVELTESPPP